MPAADAASIRREWFTTADAVAVTQLRRQLMAAAAEVMSEDGAHGLGIAASEVLGNVVRHAYDGRSGPCRLFLTCDANTAVVVVEDDGRGIPSSVCGPFPKTQDLDAESGRGLRLARHFVDELVCSRGASGGTRVELRCALE